MSTPRHSWLPAVLAEIAEVAGLEAALALAGARGGTEIYVPPAVEPDHWLVEATGRAAAEAICRHFAGNGHGCRLEIPLGPKGAAARLRRQVDRMIAAGKSEREIALATGYSGRGVRLRKARDRARRESDQGSLF